MLSEQLILDNLVDTAVKLGRAEEQRDRLSEALAKAEPELKKIGEQADQMFQTNVELCDEIANLKESIAECHNREQKDVSKILMLVDATERLLSHLPTQTKTQEPRRAALSAILISREYINSFTPF